MRFWLFYLKLCFFNTLSEFPNKKCKVLGQISAFKEAARLFEDLLAEDRYPFQTKFRPIKNHKNALIVYLGLRISQLMDVDEKNQIITMNAWLDHEWTDEYLQWNPNDYGGLQEIHFPRELLWIPDIVLQNNADGSFVMEINTPAQVFYNGRVRWAPPAVFKSFCNIRVEFFPFDIQECEMKFGVWSTDGHQVELKHVTQKFLNEKNAVAPVEIDYAANLHDFYASVEFDILELKAQVNKSFYNCCKAPFYEIYFYVTLRRKTLFYTINLILPCVAISFLTLLVFYLPSQSGEKITLSINIMLSLTVFFLLLAETVPPTGLFIPLIGKYLLFTMINVSLSIVATVIVLNVHSRSVETHVMATWVRVLFLHILPKLLMMQRPWVIETQQKIEDDDDDNDSDRRASIWNKTNSSARRSSTLKAPLTFKNRNITNEDVELKPVSFNSHKNKHSPLLPQLSAKSTSTEKAIWLPTCKKARKNVLHIHKFVRNIRYIAEYLHRLDHAKSIQEDWRYVAMVLDRLFLWIFSVACILGTLGIMLQAPAIYDTREPLTAENSPKIVKVSYDVLDPLLNVTTKNTEDLALSSIDEF